MAELNTHGQDPDYVPDGDGINPGVGRMDMAIYGMQHAARWRTKEPQDDLTTYILTTEFGGKLMTDLDFGVFFVQLVTAGQDTTQTMLASGLHTLLLHPGAAGGAARRPEPDPRRRRGDPALRQPAALLPPHGDGRHGARTGRRSRPATRSRCTTPRPTATRTSSTDPQAFDIHRQPNPHLSFGIAAALLPRRAPGPAGRAGSSSRSCSTRSRRSS